MFIRLATGNHLPGTRRTKVGKEEMINFVEIEMNILMDLSPLNLTWGQCDQIKIAKCL